MAPAHGTPWVKPCVPRRLWEYAAGNPPNQVLEPPAVGPRSTGVESGLPRLKRQCSWATSRVHCSYVP